MSKHILTKHILEGNEKSINRKGTKHILGFPVIRTIMRDELEQIPWGVQKINSEYVWETCKSKGKEIKIGIIDTGIDKNHPDLKDNVKGGYNFLELDDTDDILDDNGHGTHVAGVIAALANQTGIIGVSPEASLYGVKCMDSEGIGEDYNIVKGINWCVENKMDIINMSFGDVETSKAEKDALDNAIENGVVLVAAAGNSGVGKDTIDYPAKHDDVIAVGATNKKDKRASFSSMGPKLEVMAPGEDILSTTPGSYFAYSGTSMACPHVVGEIALLMSYNSELRNDSDRVTKIRQIIDSGVLHLGIGTTGGRNLQFGFGRVDAKKAFGNLVKE
jgi:subtilisin family serine protease